MGFPGGTAIKNSPVTQEMWVLSPDWEDPLEKEMATHSCILVWEIPWTEEPSGLQSIDFPGSPVPKTPHSKCRGPGIQSLVGELDPTCCN